MLRTRNVCLIIGLILHSSTGLGDTIYIKKGQCIKVGNQEVCAEDGGKAKEKKKVTWKTLFSCRYRDSGNSEVVGLKTHTLYRTDTPSEGEPRESLIKDFGINGKDACDKEMEKRTQEWEKSQKDKK